MATGIVENFNPAANAGTIVPTDGAPPLQFVAAMIAAGTVLHEDARVEYDVVMVAGLPQPHNIRLF
ncbi:cold-shock protein [Streptomyces platensis]|uniref:cold-shock protein n=1 Tax=Streptomyces platensis TaxID=58346 RepID=UPI003C30C467